MLYLLRIMKKKSSFFDIISILLISVVFFACSNTQSSIIVVPDSETLRSESDVRYSQVLWSSEIEGDRLSDPENTDGDLAQFLPQALGSLNSGGKPFVYPELTGFGSLDTTELTTDVRNKIDSFIKDFFEGNNTSSSLRSGRKWLPFVLRSSFNSFTKCDKWIYGKPYISADNKYPVYEMPVRLYSGNTYVDIIVSLLPENADNTIDNGVLFIDKETFLQQDFFIDQINVGDIVRG